MASFVDQLIEKGTLAVGQKAADWEDSVRLGGLMMVNTGLVENRYIDAIIENHKTIGPYFVIAPGIAMPHAKPEKGVLETGYALVTLSEPVEFGDEENDPVDILIFAGAVNQEEHNRDVIPQVAEICDSEEYVEKIRRASDVEELTAVLLDFQRALEAGELE